MTRWIDRLASLARPVLGGLGLLWLAFGVWAFVAPHSFYGTVATFEPYNRHFVHDVGAMQLGLGVGAIAGALTTRAVVAGLTGLSGFQVAHVLSHVIDRNRGGEPWFDIPSLSLLAAAGLVTLVAIARRGDEGDPASPLRPPSPT